MARQVAARFLVDRPVLPGMVRAILDTLTAQGGAYSPQLVRRAAEAEGKRITWGRASGLPHDVGATGTQTTFLRVAEGRPEPVLSFDISETPRLRPSIVTLTVPAAAITGSQDIERILGVCKGLYLFLEAPLGIAGLEGTLDDPSQVAWANFYGPQMVVSVGPAKLLTSMAFIVEILPDGGIMLVSHPAPADAATDGGLALCRALAEATGVLGPVRSALAAVEKPGGGRRTVDLNLL